MSSTVSPANGGDVSQSDPPALRKGTTLKIDVPAETDTTSAAIETVIEPLAGQLPRDFPFWHNHSEIDEDVRGLLPFTIRYCCTEAQSYMIPSHDHEEIRSAIWREVGSLLEDDENLPRIRFDQRSNGTSSNHGVLELVFESHYAMSEVEKHLERLEIKDSDGTVSVYEQQSTTNSLAGDILVFECLRLPLDGVDPQQLLEAFTAVAAPVGSVFGIGQPVTKSKENGDKRWPSGATRGYIKIHRSNMAVPWSQLVRRLPTHFLWHGYPYTLNFPGRQHHKRDLLSADYPLIQSKGNEESEKRADGASNSKRARQSKEGPEALKKRKAPSDQ